MVDFSGPTAANPGVQLLNASGTVLRSGLNGLGLAARVTTAGTYYLQVQANSAGLNVGQYVGVVNRYGHATETAENGDTLDNNTLFSFNALDFSQVVGSLDSTGDVDVFRLDVTNFAKLDFSLQAPGTEIAADWRSTQTISGTRVDPSIGFSTNSWGARSEVGLTSGTDANWDNFSAQWDGWIKIVTPGTRLQLRSDDSSRMWVDVNNDGTFQTSELLDNNFGVGQSLTAGTLSEPLAVGSYRIRVQYEEGGFDNRLYLEMVTPDKPGEDDGFGHGPSVIGTSFVPGQTLSTLTNSIDVLFSGAIQTSTLTPQNFKLRYSPNAVFFDGNDTFLSDSDGTIAWDPTRHLAQFTTGASLADGYYMLELRGSSGGIAARAYLSTIQHHCRR